MSKILIVEDEETLIKVLADKFSEEGFEVSQAVNGEEGLNKALAEKPDLILLDIVMPVMDGLTMLAKLRQDEWGKDAKVVLLTNLSDNEQVAKAFDNNVHDYLIKTDWKISDLIEKVKQKIGE